MAQRKAFAEVGRGLWWASRPTGINPLIRARLPSATRLSSTEAPSTSMEVKLKSGYKSSPRHDMAAFFTCVKCNTRSVKTFSRESYEEGVVIVRCGGCQNLHVLSDRLGMFGEKGSVEDFLAEKGETVKRASEDTYEFALEDLTGRKAK